MQSFYEHSASEQNRTEVDKLIMTQRSVDIFQQTLFAAKTKQEKLLSIMNFFYYYVFLLLNYFTFFN
jgi:hypothetical protein